VSGNHHEWYSRMEPPRLQEAWAGLPGSGPKHRILGTPRTHKPACPSTPNRAGRRPASSGTQSRPALDPDRAGRRDSGRRGQHRRRHRTEDQCVRKDLILCANFWHAP